MSRHVTARAIAAFAELAGARLAALLPYDAALILYALPPAPELTVVRRQLARRLGNFLRLEYVRSGDPATVYLALAALWAYRPADVSADMLAAAVQRLVAAELAPGGPYAFDGAASPGVHAAIAAFAGKVAQPLPAVQVFLGESLSRQEARPPCGACAAVPAYLLARSGGSQTVATLWWRTQKGTVWNSVVGRAAAVYAFRRATPTGTPDDKRPDWLAGIEAAQQSDGFWTAEPCRCQGEGAGAGAGGAGVRQPSAGLAVSACVLGALHVAPPRAGTRGASVGLKRSTVIAASRRLFSGHAEPLRSSALKLIETIDRVDTNNEITLLPHFFAVSLRQPLRLPSETYSMLGAANVCTWAAYTVYDDFLDDEGDPAALPVANVAMRAALRCLRQAVPQATASEAYIEAVFAGMDEANAWEVRQCRFGRQNGTIVIPQLPRYDAGAVLARRAFAHVLPLMLLLFERLPTGGRAVKQVEAAFKHYLIARQLNDDMHDWAKDIAAGQASYVVTAILRDLKVGPGTYDLAALEARMRPGFRQVTMPRLCQDIRRHVRAARQRLVRSQLFVDDNPLYELLDTLEASVCDAEDRREKSRVLSTLPLLARKTAP